jgi:2-dehydropantoate 2-reductase
MKTLIFGAGPLGSLYTCLLHKAGMDVTLLARNEHYKFLKENGIVLINEFTQEKIIEKVKVVDLLEVEDSYDLVIVLMRKNSLKHVLPVLSKNKKIANILFMGNNTIGFDEYLKVLPKEKVLFGFPGGGGSRIHHVVYYVDSEKPGGERLSITLGEIDGKTRERTKQIRHMFESADVPVKLVDDIDSWLKYHVAFINPIAGALLKSGDNYKLAQDNETIRTYLRAVKEGGKVLKALGYSKSYNFKLKLFNWPAKDEMIELGNDFKTLKNQTSIKTPNLDKLMACIV